MAYALMESRTQEAYLAVLQRLRDMGLSPRWLMADHEQALQNALRVAFPDAEVHGCLWHFAIVSAATVPHYWGRDETLAKRT